ATVFDELVGDGALFHRAVGDGEVTAIGRVKAKLRRELLLRVPGAGEDDETARLLVDAMDDAERRPSLALSGKMPADEIVEGRPLFILERDGRDSGRLSHDDDLGIDVDDQIGLERSLAGSGRIRTDLDRAPGPDFALGNEAGLTVDDHFPGRDERPRLPPREP